MVRKRFPMSPTPSFFDPTKYFPEGFFFNTKNVCLWRSLSSYHMILGWRVTPGTPGNPWKNPGKPLPLEKPLETPGENFFYSWKK